MHTFIIRLMLTNLGELSVLWKKLMEKNGFWRSEYGYFITVKCPLCGTDGYKKMKGGRVSLQGGAFCHCRVRLVREKVILTSCHWRAVLPSHKSILLLRPDEMGIKRKEKFERGVFVSAYRFFLGPHPHGLPSALHPSLTCLLSNKW